MFYLVLENQLSLFIILTFSSYLYISSLTVGQSSVFHKYFGTSFFMPIILSLLSFLTINREWSESFLFFAEFILLCSILLLLFTQRAKQLSLLMFVFLYAFPLSIVILNINFNGFHRSSLTDLFISLFSGIMLIMMISSFFLKKKEKSLLHWGFIFICVSLLITHIQPKETTTAVSLILKCLGYMMFSIYFYNNTYKKLKESFKEKASSLDRINNSLQREVNRRVEDIERSNKKLVEIAKTDNLTKAYTKNAIMDFIDSIITKSPAKQFSILMFDIDNFKSVNDTYGHIIGDKCIKQLAAVSKNSLRGDDKFGRYGGDEFIILLPDTNAVKAFLVADRIRKNVEKLKDPAFTISVGISSYPQDAATTKALVNAADKALYISKEKGRNMVTHINEALINKNEVNE